MGWLFQYCTDGSTWVEIDNSKVPVDSVRHVSQRHQDLKPSTDTFEFSVKVPTTALLNAILGNNRFPFKASLDGSGIFSGWISTETTAAAALKVERVGIKAYDDSWLLDRKTDITISWSNYYVCKAADTAHSIVHQLLLLYGLPAGKISPTDELTQIDYFVAESDKTYDELLTNLLYEFGWVYYFDGDGVFRTEGLFPADVTTSATFDDTNIAQPLQIKKKFVQKDGVEIAYWPHETLASALISTDTSGQDDVNKCNVELAADGWYPVNSDSTSVYTEFSVPNKELIIATDGVLDYSAESGIVVSSPTWYPTKVLVSFHNTAAGPKHILKYDVIGNAVVKGDKGIVRVFNNDEQGADLLVHEARYLTTYAQASYLCSGAARYYKFSSVSYQFVSREKVAVGTIVQLTDAVSGISQVCRIYARSATWQIDGTAFYEYGLEGIAAYSLETIVKEGTHSAPPSLPRPADTVLTGAFRTEVLSGFKGSGGTTTPTVPTIQMCKGVFQGIALLWDRQLNLTNFHHYDVQVSNDNSSWFAPCLDGSDWKGEADGVAEILTELFVHTGLTGSATLYYKVRRVTKLAAASAYSPVASALPTITADATAAINSLYANVVTAGVLNAIFANIVGQLVIGATYDVIGASPGAGDQKLILDNNELGLYEYDGSAWGLLLRVGGDDELKRYFQSQGLIRTGADVSGIEMGDAMPAGFKRWKFAADYADESGADNWNAKNGTSFEVDSDFPRGSVLRSTHALGTTGGLGDTATFLWTPGNSCAVDMYCKAESGLDLAYLWYLKYGANVFAVKFNSDATISVFAMKDDSPETAVTLAASFDVLHHVSAGYDASADKLYLVVDGTGAQSESVLGGSWTATGTRLTECIATTASGDVGKVSDVIAHNSAMLGATIAASIAKAQAHYASGENWAYGFDSTQDLPILAKGTGKIRLLSDTAYYAPVAGEPSLGTPHAVAYANRSTTLVVDTSTNTAGTWSAAVTMTDCGAGGGHAGAKAAWALVRIKCNTGFAQISCEQATGVTLVDTTSGNNRFLYHTLRLEGSATSNVIEAPMKIPLDANGQFKWCTGITNSTVAIGAPIEYEE